MENEKDELINLLCGRELGSGIHRVVFECKLNPNWVVKVANNDGRQANLMEAKIWEEVSWDKNLKKWFAPVISVSEAGKFLIMEKAEQGRHKDYPKEIPVFLTDVKMDNYGWIGNNFVCFDYSLGLITRNWGKRMKKVEWKKL